MMDVVTLALAKNYSSGLYSTATKNLVEPNMSDIVIIDDFSTGWTGSGAEDVEHVRYGFKSIKLTHDGVGAMPQITKTFEQGKNLLGKVLLFSFYVEDSSNIFQIAIRFRVHGTNKEFLCGMLTHQTGTNRIITEGWNTYSVPLMRLTGDSGLTPADWTNVTSINIRIESYNNVTSSVTLDAILAIQNPLTNGLISLDFDDARESVYSVARPILSQYGFRGTACVIPTEVGKPRYANIHQLRTLEDMGWDIASHGYSHATLSQIPKEDIEGECSLAYEWLIRNGFRRGIDHLVYAGTDVVTPDMLEVVPKYYATGRLSTQIYGGQALPTMDRYKRGACAVHASTSIEAVKTLIDGAVQHKTWLTLYFHGFLAGEGLIQDPGRLEAIVEYIHQSQATVVTTSDIFPTNGGTHWFGDTRNTSSTGVVLRAENGSFYKIEVTNDGEIVATLVQ